MSLDELVLARVDRAARRLGLSRSAYIARAVAHGPNDARGPGATVSARRAMRSLDRLFREGRVPGDATLEIRRMRDER